MADERVKIPEGEFISALKNDGSTDERVKVRDGELLDAIKNISGGGTPPDLSSYEKKVDHTTDITNLQNTKQDKGDYALKTDLPDISGKQDKFSATNGLDWKSGTSTPTLEADSTIARKTDFKLKVDTTTNPDMPLLVPTDPTTGFGGVGYMQNVVTQIGMVKTVNDAEVQSLVNVQYLQTNYENKTDHTKDVTDLATKHQNDFNLLQTQIGGKQGQIIAGNGIKITGNTISVDPTVVTIWKPVTITQPTNRVANFTLATGIYRIGFTFDQPTEVNYQYVTYRVVNVAGQNNEILTFYRDSGVAGAIPNVLALRCVPAGFEIYDKYGTSTGYGAIMRVDIQATT